MSVALTLIFAIMGVLGIGASIFFFQNKEQNKKQKKIQDKFAWISLALGVTFILLAVIPSIALSFEIV